MGSDEAPRMSPHAGPNVAYVFHGNGNTFENIRAFLNQCVRGRRIEIFHQNVSYVNTFMIVGTVRTCLQEDEITITVDDDSSSKVQVVYSGRVKGRGYASLSRKLHSDGIITGCLAYATIIVRPHNFQPFHDQFLHVQEYGTCRRSTRPSGFP